MDKQDYSRGDFFAGANSGEGFICYYGDLLGEKIKRCYILKGGPGTGKSSFLKSAAKHATERGHAVELYSCSSDPDSLDLITVDGEIALLDGTAPHVWEPQIAGARDEIINLGAFWDADALTERYDEIAMLCKKKSECYRLAYRYLDAAKRVSDINLSLVMPYFKTEKAERAAERIFSAVATGGGFERTVGAVSSIGMQGRVRYDTYERLASKLYIIDDCYDTGFLFLRLLLVLAERSNTPLRISYDPLSPERPDALFFRGDRKTFVINSDGEEVDFDTRINMRRFVDVPALGKEKHEYRANKRLESALMSSALEALAKAGENHFALERIYVGCMDFDAKEEYCNTLLARIFK